MIFNTQNKNFILEFFGYLGPLCKAVEAIGCIVTKDYSLAAHRRLRDDLFLPKLADWIMEIDDFLSTNVYEAVLTKVYAPLCISGAGYLDLDEPPPRLSLETVKLFVVPPLEKISVVMKTDTSDISASSLLGRLEAIHGTSFRHVVHA